MTRKEIETDQKTPVCSESRSRTAYSRLELIHSLSQIHLFQIQGMLSLRSVEENSYTPDMV